MQFVYLIFINSIAFLLCGADKWLAIKGGYRIPEKVLLFTALIGGAIGLYGAMQIFRHKTRKAKFSLGVLVIILIQIAFVMLLNHNM